MTEDTKSRKNGQTRNYPVGPPAIHFDWRDWEQYIEDADASDEEKRKLIETLFVIVLGFVDLGFGLNPEQEICGEDIDLTAVLQAAVLGSRDQPTPADDAAVKVVSGTSANGGRL